MSDSGEVDDDPPSNVHYRTWGPDHDYAAVDPESHLCFSDMESQTDSEKDAGSESGYEVPSPALSERSTGRSSRGGSSTTPQTSASTRSTRSQNNPEFVAKQKSFMAKVQAASSGTDSPPNNRPETPNASNNNKRKRDNTNAIIQGKKRKLAKMDNNGQVRLKFIELQHFYLKFIFLLLLLFLIYHKLIFFTGLSK